MRHSRLLALTAGFLVVAACGDSNGPSANGAPYFSATVDLTGWSADTAIAWLYGSDSDTTLVIGAGRTASISQLETITLFVHHFGSPGQFALADTTSPAFGGFSVFDLSGPLFDPVFQYWTQPQGSGTLTVTGLTQDDSLVTGRFSFEAATIPDSVPHRRVSGSFRLRYQFQPVFTPIRLPLP
jgi:hypothetical protein